MYFRISTCERREKAFVDVKRVLKVSLDAAKKHKKYRLVISVAMQGPRNQI